MDILRWINENIVWGIPILILFAACGIIFTFKTGFMQIVHFPQILKCTVLSKKKSQSDKNSISPFKALTAALGTTVGTGNIIAVGTAIAFGGAGAVFWMWISAILGMATSYAENYLGAKYRRYKDSVPFYYIKKAFGSKKFGSAAAVMFAVCCIGASLGIGNMVQVNSAAVAVNKSMGIPLWVVGLICACAAAFIAPGGVKRLGNIASFLIPFASVGYILGCIAVIVFNYEMLPQAFLKIFSEAFSLRSVSGSIAGSVMAQALTWGVKRGVFSNEAGLGSSVMINAASSEKNCSICGMWGMLSVFVDTIIICTMTALAILCSNADLKSQTGFDMAFIAFSEVLGNFAGIFLGIALLIFAVSTVCGWWIYGKTCFIYLFGEKYLKIYLAIFISAAFIGAIIKAQAVWELSDLFNGLMAVFNLPALLILRKEVKNYHGNKD